MGVTLLCCVVLFLSHAPDSIFSFNSLQIKDLTMIKCASTNYPVLVDKVVVQLGSKPKFKVTGSLFTQIDLSSPITAMVYLKRQVWGIWIPMPCENEIGSCTYNNLCDYGYSTNVTCPDVFLKNNVPCRCPIPKGNYTIAPSLTFDLPRDTSILSGKYKGTIEVTHNQSLLSCYNIYFVLYDADADYNMYSVIEV